MTPHHACILQYAFYALKDFFLAESDDDVGLRIEQIEVCLFGFLFFLSVATLALTYSDWFM